MGLTPSYLRLLVKLSGELGLEVPVLSLGNQDVYASAADVRSFFEQMGRAPREPARILAHTSAAFARHWADRARDFIHARTVFEMLGIDGYVDLDRFPDDAPMRHRLAIPTQGLYDRSRPWPSGEARAADRGAPRIEVL